MNFTNPNEFWRHNWYDPYKGMSDDERLTAGCLQVVVMILFVLFALAVCMLMGGCTTERVVTVEKVRTDTVRLTRTAHDSIYIHDSTYIKEAGDTVRIERWHTRYIEKQVHDTIYQSRTDSVPKPYPFVKVVERELTTNQKGLMILGAVALMVFLVWIIFELKRFLI